MKNITNELMAEHRNILKVIELVQNECDRIGEGKEPDEAFFRDVVLFIRNYADGYHHAKEEDVLFKAMMNNFQSSQNTPVQVMLREHDAGRQYVKGMAEALELKKWEDLVTNARGYCNLLVNHIYKEDNILYPMAERMLSESEKEKVAEAYSRIHSIDFTGTDTERFIEDFISKHAPRNTPDQ
jgi:hemerythrin-like domain-containing protein